MTLSFETVLRFESGSSFAFSNSVETLDCLEYTEYMNLAASFSMRSLLSVRCFW